MSGTRGPSALGGPLDFFHPCPMVVTPLMIATTVTTMVATMTTMVTTMTVFDAAIA